MADAEETAQGMLAEGSKPRVRVKAWTNDSFQNVAANLGYGTNNLTSASTYGFNPVGRNHTQLAWMYRGSWMVRKVVDQIADDMTRAGVDFDDLGAPDEVAKVHNAWRDLKISDQLRDTIKWARLYGGAAAVICIDGQKADTPLRLDTIGLGQFKGLMVFDRWVIQPEPGELIQEMGASFGYPMYYNTVAGPEIPMLRIHHSRIIRFEGDPLPYWQRITEMGWGASVIEQLYDRMIAFDSATTGAAQLVYKAHLRTMKVKDLRKLIATGNKFYQAFLENVKLIRSMQTNEGLTIIDSEDDMTHFANTAMSGISDALARFGEQLSGACGIPLVLLFGQSPAGFSTGETDIRNYYDRINSKQASEMDDPVRRILAILSRSVLGRPPKEGWGFNFKSLWQLTEQGKADLADKIATSIVNVHAEGIISDKVAMQELKQQSRETGIFGNITDEDIEAASDELPDPEGEGMDDPLNPMMGHNGGPPMDPNAPTSALGKAPAGPGAVPATPGAPKAAKGPGGLEKDAEGMMNVQGHGLKGVRVRLHPDIAAKINTDSKKKGLA